KDCSGWSREAHEAEDTANSTSEQGEPLSRHATITEMLTWRRHEIATSKTASESSDILPKVTWSWARKNARTRTSWRRPRFSLLALMLNIRLPLRLWKKRHNAGIVIGRQHVM